MTELDRKVVAQLEGLDLQSFMKAFVASLVSCGIDGLVMDEPMTKAGCAAVVRFLDGYIAHLMKRKTSPVAMLPLVYAVNDLRCPGPTGGYGGFEQALLARRRTFTSPPDIWSGKIEFTVGKVQAESYLKSIPVLHSKVATAAAETFVKAGLARQVVRGQVPGIKVSGVNARV